MQALVVEGGRRLSGTRQVDGAKNAALPILAACVLTEEPVTLHHVPDILDVRRMADILRMLGCKADMADHAVTAGHAMYVDCAAMDAVEMPDALSKQIRSSIFLLGPILSRFRRATVTYPGGCEIGLRPIDLHLSGLKALGVRVREEGGVIHCDGSHMHPGDVHLDYPSVGATENVIMAATLLPGVTTIHNAAREPEIVDLCRFLTAMGSPIEGAGSATVQVTGVHSLHGAEYTPMPDRIVAGTLLAAAAITGGDVELTNAPVDDMHAVCAKLREMGCVIREGENTLALSAPPRLTAFPLLQTQPHPGFPTDMQAQMMALLSVSEGTGVVVENVFENRFTHAGEMNRMGASILCTGRTAIVRGVEKLIGTRVTARDLRGGAALVLAGLAAQGETHIDNAAFIDRGYECLEGQLAALGASIRRIEA